MGDVVFKGFQCLNSECAEFLLVKKDDISEFFEIECPSCGFVHKYGDETKFYDYELTHLQDKKILETGAFTILHDDYIAEAQEYKYCIICNAIKPLDFFDRHSARKSKRQGECRLCKQVYNSIKNQTRIADQHREAAQKRRLYVELTGGRKIDSHIIYDRFEYKCFKCGLDLSGDLKGGEGGSTTRGGNLDHTLPAMYLWPLTTENATLLCKEHNAQKAEKWPKDFYTPQELRRLVTLTGIDFEALNSKPFFNPDAMVKLQDPPFVDQLLAKYAAYMDELIKVRNRILKATEFDFFATSRHISPAWIERANQFLIGD